MSIGKAPDFRWLFDGVKKSRLIDLRSKVAPILDNNLLPHFTDHSVSHSDRMIEYVDKIIEPIQDNSKKITDEELYILYAACYLHDIGMGYEKAGNTRTIADLELEQDWKDLSEETHREYLRKYHHKISAELVLRSAPTCDRPINIQLNQEDKPEYIACLCEAHCIDVDLDDYKNLIKVYSNFRLPLLSGILRIADIIDESRRRADPAKAKVLELDLSSQTHWWRHYYIEEVTFDKESRIIFINFDFPKEYENEYKGIIPQLQIPLMQNEILNHMKAFNPVGLGWLVKENILDKTHRIVEKMPDPVLHEMIKELHPQKVMEYKKVKQVELQSFQEAQPDINRRLSELQTNKAKITPQEYLRDLIRICKNLYQIGAKKSSWILSWQDFLRSCTTLKKDEQIEIGLWLIQIIQEDKNPKEALRILDKIKGIVEELSNSDKRKEEFFNQQTRLLIDICNYEEAIKAIKAAIELFKQGELVEELETQLSELHLLQGELDSVPDTEIDSKHGGSPEGPLIDCLSSFTRKLLVKYRVLAMKGEVKRSLQELRDTLNSKRNELKPLEQIFVLMLQAEILYLDGREEESSVIFEEEIHPILDSIPQDSHNIKIIVEDNYCVVALNRLKSESLQKYYQLTDFRKLSGVQLMDADALVSAYESADAGKLYDAFPIYWQQLLRSYYLGSWRSFKWASNRLAKECLKLNSLPEAAFYSILAVNEKIAEEVGNQLLELKDQNLIKITVEKIVNYSNLFDHSIAACKIIDCIADAIPNEQIESVFQWVSQKCLFSPQDLMKTKSFINAFGALKALSLRLDLEQTKKVLKLITNHELWKTRSHLRAHLVKVLYNCPIKRLSSEDLADLSKGLQLLATDYKSDSDYPDVISLLCFIAGMVENTVKTEIANNLYPENSQGVNVLLAQVSEKFGKPFNFKDGLKKAVERTVNNIRFQVQHLNINEKPKPVNELYFSFNSTTGDKMMVVNVVGTRHLKLITKQRKSLKPDMVKLIVDAILEMISDPNNETGNKIALIDSLKELSSKLSKTVGNEIFQVLEPIILGKTGKGIFEKMNEEANNPMNPFKFRGSSQTELRGVSLYALAFMEKHHPGLFGERINPLIENALFDVDPVIRKFAFAASREIPELSDQALTGVLFGTRDPNPDAAFMAFDTLISKKDQKLSDYHWQLLSYSIVMAARSSNIKLRRIVAFTIKTYRESIPSSIASKINEVENELANDTCHSVRVVFEEEEN